MGAFEAAFDEASRLKRTLNDLIGIMALPALWAGGDSSRIAGTLLDALMAMLGPALAWARLDTLDDSPVVVVRIARPWSSLLHPSAIDQIVAQAGERSTPESEPRQSEVVVDGAPLRVVPVPLGLHASLGTLVVASDRPGFPSAAERLILDVAATQTAVALQQARLLVAQRRLTTELDARVAQRTADLNAVNQALQAEIGERRLVEVALRASERDSRLVVDTIPGLVVVLSADGSVDIENSRTREYLGPELANTRQWTSNGIVHPDDTSRVVPTFVGGIASGERFEYEVRLRRFDGVYRWFQLRAHPLRGSAGEVLRWYVLLTDVDDRKRAEETTRARERDLRLIIDTIPALAWSTLPDGRVDFLNQHYLSFVGLTADQSTDWDWTGAIHPDDLNSLQRTWQRILASRAPGEAEARLRGADGSYRWFLFRVNPFRNEQGEIVRWYGINTEIEGRKRAEAALNQARTELAHVARVTSLSTLTASIAHEVNQPLSGIVTNASASVRMLDATPPDLDGARETARRIIRDGHRASDVIGRLRALFCKKALAVERLDLNEAAEEVVALSMSELQRQRILVQCELQHELPPVVGDRIQLQEVILNLVRNAADAMADVETRSRVLLIATCLDGGDYVRLTVRDSGVGIDRDHLDRLFEAFYTTKTGGMGIGLSISRAIVERHQGRLWCEPNDDHGVTFGLRLPRSLENTGDPTRVAGGS